MLGFLIFKEVKIKMKNFDDLYKTKDFYLACFLRTKGLSLKKVFKVEDVYYFCFLNNGCVDKLISDFYSGDENVSPTDFINSIRVLKSLIHSFSD